MPDVTITFRVEDYYRLPAETQELIGIHCAVLWPDSRGVVTMVLMPSQWRQIQETMEAAAK